MANVTLETLIFRQLKREFVSSDYLQHVNSPVVSWERGKESNPLPPAYEAGDLPLIYPAYYYANTSSISSLPSRVFSSAMMLNVQETASSGSSCCGLVTSMRGIYTPIILPLTEPV